MNPGTEILRKFETLVKYLFLIIISAFCCYSLLNSVTLFLWGDPSVNGVPRIFHPPEIIILHYVSIISPQLAKIILTLFFWSAGIFTYLGFHQITPKTSLNNPLREKIVTFIKNNPGRHFSSIMRETGINRGTLYYHLHLLKSLGKITESKDGGLTRYYLQFNEMSSLQKKIVSHYDNPVRDQIIGMLATQTCCSRKTLKTSLKMSGPALWYHMQMLEKDGIILTEMNKNHVGRSVQYLLTQRAVEILKTPEMLHQEPDHYQKPQYSDGLSSG